MPKKLNPKQEQFCQEYIIDLNATAAYIRAGYSERLDSARANAYRMMENDGIQARIHELQSFKAARNRVLREMSINTLMEIATADISDYVVQDDEGRVYLKPFADISEEKRRAIAGFNISKDGFSIRFESRVSAIGKLQEMLGLNMDISKLILALENYGIRGWIENGRLRVEDARGEQ